VVDDLPDSSAAAVLVEDLARRIDAMRGTSADEIAVRIELTGASPLARTLRDEEERRQIEADLMGRTGAIEVQLRSAGLSLPFDPAVLRESPTVVSKALDLIEAAARNPARLESLVPEQLATSFATGEERRAYLASLLTGLADELIERSVAGDEA
jgi:hypothetical protein